MSDCCCCCPTQPPPPPGGGGDPTQPPRCTRYQVTINSFSVTAIDDGFLGGDLETTWTFVVNGQVQTFIDNDMDVGITPVGITFFVDVPADTSTIVLQVTGVEDDTVFDDDLPGFTHVWGQAQNWGVGFQAGAASDSNITYSLNYQITCASQSAVSLSRSALLAYAADKAKKRKKARKVTAATLASWGLERLRRGGWDLVQATDHAYLLKGYGTLPRLIEDKYGERPA